MFSLLFLGVLFASVRNCLSAAHLRGHHLYNHSFIPSYHCTDAEKRYQYDYADLMHISICDSNTPWKLAQLAMPDATTFLDIGCNRAYTSALIFALWSPGDGLTPSSLYAAIDRDVKSGLNTNNDNMDTVCADGRKPNIAPLICQGRLTDEGAKCSFRRPIQVFGFDGQRSHVENQRATIYHAFPHLNPDIALPSNSGRGATSGVKSSWEYIHAAMTSHVDSPDQKGYFRISTHEGGALVTSIHGKPDDAEEIPVTTVDMFCEQRGIASVDILKIDAEGSDRDVIRGAMKTLATRGVKMITYEAAYNHEWEELIHVLDTKYGFDCYHNGEANILVRVTNCWDMSLATNAELPNCVPSATVSCPDSVNAATHRIDGNGYCVHRTRAAALHSMFEDMSLYKYADGSRGHLLRDSLVGMPWTHYESSGDGVMRINRDTYFEEKFERNFGRKFGTFEKKWN